MSCPAIGFYTTGFYTTGEEIRTDAPPPPPSDMQQQQQRQTRRRRRRTHPFSVSEPATSPPRVVPSSSRRQRSPHLIGRTPESRSRHPRLPPLLTALLLVVATLSNHGFGVATAYLVGREDGLTHGRLVRNSLAYLRLVYPNGTGTGAVPEEDEEGVEEDDRDEDDEDEEGGVDDSEDFRRNDDGGNHNEEEDSVREVLSRLGEHVDDLVRGQIDAEYGNGMRGTLGGGGSSSVPRNSIGHYYNPSTRGGYRAGSGGGGVAGTTVGGVGGLRRIKLLERAGWLDGSVSQVVRGPAVSAADLAEWYYAAAVHHYLLHALNEDEEEERGYDEEEDEDDEDEGGEDSSTSKNETTAATAGAIIMTSMEEAAKALGMATHVLLDVTVPQHAADCGDDNPACHHAEYERFVEDGLTSGSIVGADVAPRATYDTLRFLANPRSGDRPSDVVRNVAAVSSAYLDDASSGDADRMAAAAGALLPLAQEVAAAVMLRFALEVTETAATLAAEAGGGGGDNDDGDEGDEDEDEEDGITVPRVHPPPRVAVFRISRVTMRGPLTGETSRADLRPVVQFLPPPPTSASSTTSSIARASVSARGGYTAHAQHRRETRGWIADSNDVRPSSGLDPYGWTFVHVVTDDEIEAGTVEVRFRIQDVNTNLWSCGRRCDSSSRDMALGPGGRTEWSASLSLSSLTTNSTISPPVVSSTDGCDDSRRARNRCADSVRVEYVFGLAHQISADADGGSGTRGAGDVFLEVQHGGISTEGIVVSSILSGLALFVGAFVAFHCAKCHRRRRRKKGDGAFSKDEDVDAIREAIEDEADWHTSATEEEDDEEAQNMKEKRRPTSKTIQDLQLRPSKTTLML